MTASSPVNVAPLFLFDANAWITGYSELYPQVVFPNVWRRMSDEVEAGVIASPEEIINEVTAQDDEINAWVSERKEKLLAPLSASGKAQEVFDAVQELQDKHGDIGTRTGADYFLICWGKAMECPIITLEKNEKNKIPVVCRKEDVECISFGELMRRRKWRFE